MKLQDTDLSWVIFAARFVLIGSGVCRSFRIEDLKKAELKRRKRTLCIADLGKGYKQSTI